MFPLHLTRLLSSARLPHTAMFLLLHLDRIALLAARSSHDMSFFLPQDASRPIRLSSPLSTGSPSPYPASSELRPGRSPDSDSGQRSARSGRSPSLDPSS